MGNLFRNQKQSTMGMKEKQAEQAAKMMMQSRGMVLMTRFLCGLAPLIISSTFAGIYLSLGAVAQKYADDNEFFCGGNSRCFDLCSNMVTNAGFNAAISDILSGTGLENTTSSLSIDTTWSLIFALNGGVYLTLTILTLCLICSAIIGPLAICGACLIGCAQCAHLAALIVTGVLRYSDDGKECASRDTQKVSEDVTFADVGATIEGLFIAQCVLYCFYGCCIMVLTQTSVMLYFAKKA